MDAKRDQAEPATSAAAERPGPKPSWMPSAAAIASFAAGVFALLWLGAEVTISRLEKENEALEGRASQPLAKAGSATPAGQPAPLPRAAGPRQLTDEQRETILRLLHESAADGRAWFVKAGGDAEASAYAESLASVFRAAGWSVEVEVWSNGTLKPGVRLFVGADEPPPSIETVTRALEAGGVAVQQFLGYRAYRAERVRAGAGAAGIDLRDDQDFAIVVGRAE